MFPYVYSSGGFGDVFDLMAILGWIGFAHDQHQRNQYPLLDSHLLLVI